MAAAYTKEFLVEAFVSRYTGLGIDIEQRQRNLANHAYDKYGRDEFRKLASLDAAAIREYKNKS